MTAEKTLICSGHHQPLLHRGELRSGPRGAVDLAVCSMHRCGSGPESRIALHRQHSAPLQHLQFLGLSASASTSAMSPPKVHNRHNPITLSHVL